MVLNRHPVDDLADIRATIRHLQERADTLPAAILAGACSLTGEQHLATVTMQSTQRFDKAAAIRALGMERLRPLLSDAEVKIVKVRAPCGDPLRWSGRGLGPGRSDAAGLERTRRGRARRRLETDLAHDLGNRVARGRDRCGWTGCGDHRRQIRSQGL